MSEWWIVIGSIGFFVALYAYEAAKDNTKKAEDKERMIKALEKLSQTE